MKAAGVSDFSLFVSIQTRLLFVLTALFSPEEDVWSMASCGATSSRCEVWPWGARDQQQLSLQRHQSWLLTLLTRFGCIKKKKKKDNMAGRRFCDKIYNKSANRTHESYTNLDLVAANSPDTSVQTSALLWRKSDQTCSVSQTTILCRVISFHTLSRIYWLCNWVRLIQSAAAQQSRHAELDPAV